MEYKQLINFDNYYIYDDGRIYSLNVKRFLKPFYDDDKYLRIPLFDNDKKRKTFYVHRLVYMTFNGEIQEGFQVDHINGIRDDNRLINLRLLTNKENNQNKHHLEMYKEIDKERYIKKKDTNKKYREVHKEEILRKQREYGKKYREEHKEEILRKQREYREKNKEEINRKKREYRQKQKNQN